METNRIQELLRDPTLEVPERDYWEVRTPWFGVCVTRESARRIMEAMEGIVPTEWVRAETMGGSAVYIKTETVMYVREWTQAQRASEHQFWKEIDKEYEEKEEPPTAPEGGEEEPESPGDATEPGIGVALFAGTALLLVLNLLKAVLL